MPPLAAIAAIAAPAAAAVAKGAAVVGSAVSAGVGIKNAIDAGKKKSKKPDTDAEKLKESGKETVTLSKEEFLAMKEAMNIPNIPSHGSTQLYSPQSLPMNPYLLK